MDGGTLCFTIENWHNVRCAELGDENLSTNCRILVILIGFWHNKKHRFCRIESHLNLHRLIFPKSKHLWAKLASFSVLSKQIDSWHIDFYPISGGGAHQNHYICISKVHSNHKYDILDFYKENASQCVVDFELRAPLFIANVCFDLGSQSSNWTWVLVIAREVNVGTGNGTRGSGNCMRTQNSMNRQAERKIIWQIPEPCYFVLVRW